MNGHESEIADDSGGQISQSFCRRSSLPKLLLMPGDRIYVFLHMIRNLHGCPSAEFGLNARNLLALLFLVVLVALGFSTLLIL